MNTSLCFAIVSDKETKLYNVAMPEAPAEHLFHLRRLGVDGRADQTRRKRRDPMRPSM